MKPLTEQHRPRKLADIRGQPVAVKAVTALLRSRQSFAVIATGPPGLGKTSLAYAIAGELGVDVASAYSGWRLIPSTRQGVDDYNEIFNACHCAPMGGGWYVILFDESERMSKATIAFLKTRLENLPPKTVVIFTSNDNLDDFTCPAIQERCLCLTFEHRAGILSADAQALVSHVWESTLGHNHAPTLADLGIAETGRLSFRAVIKALEPVLLAELPDMPTIAPECPPAELTVSLPPAEPIATPEPASVAALPIPEPEPVAELFAEPETPKWKPKAGDRAMYDTGRGLVRCKICYRDTHCWVIQREDRFAVDWCQADKLSPVEGELVAA